MADSLVDLKAQLTKTVDGILQELAEDSGSPLWEQKCFVANCWHLVESALLAERELGRQAGRAEAARAIRDHADKWWPKDADTDVQRTLRRHFAIAERVAAEPVTREQAAAALNAFVAARGVPVEAGQQQS